MVALITALPVFLQRSDLCDPLWKVSALINGMSSASQFQWLFGQGLHANSNQLLSTLGSHAVIPNSQRWHAFLLLLQSGIIGLASFYGLLFWAWSHDREARPFADGRCR